MSYLSRQFLELCDGLEDTIVCDSNEDINTVILNEDYYLSPKRYVTKAKSRIDEINEGGGRGDSISGSLSDSNSDEDDEFLSDDDIRMLESDLRLDLTSKLNTRAANRYDKRQEVSQQARDEGDETSHRASFAPSAADRIERVIVDRQRGMESSLSASGTEEKEEMEKFVLTSWFPQLTANSKVFVEGDLLVARSNSNQENERKNSSSIVERIDSRTLRTKTGNIYELDGLIDAKLASKYGMPKVMVSKFRNGFPRDWKSLVAKHSSGVMINRPDVSRRTTQSTCSLSKGGASNASLVKSRIDVDSLPRSQSGRILFPRLDFWRQERLATYPGKSLFITVESREGRSIHNSTILKETIQDQPTAKVPTESKLNASTVAVGAMKKRNLLELRVVLSDCNQQEAKGEEMTRDEATERSKREEEERDDDRSGSKCRPPAKQAKKDKDKQIDSKVMSNDRQRHSSSAMVLRKRHRHLSKCFDQKAAKRSKRDGKAEMSTDDDNRKIRFTKQLKDDTSVNDNGVSKPRKATVVNDPNSSMVLRNRIVYGCNGADRTVLFKRVEEKGVGRDRSVIAESPGADDQPSKGHRGSLRRPIKRKERKLDASDRNTTKEKLISTNIGSDAKENGETSEIRLSDEETAKCGAKKKTGCKLMAKPGTLLFKKQMREFLLQNSRCSDDDDNDFTNTTPYRKKKRFKLQGMRLNNYEDDETDEGNGVRTPRCCPMFLLPVSEKTTPIACKQFGTPHVGNINRSEIDRYIWNRKKNSSWMRKSSKITMSNNNNNDGSSQHSVIKSAEWRDFTEVPWDSLRRSDEEDDSEQDYYFSDEDNE